MPEFKLALCGDVMLGRGIDQLFVHHNSARLPEDSLPDAREYVQLAESGCGPIPHPVSPRYVWGDALQTLDDAAPDIRLINLETSLTTHPRHWPGKGIHYRLHPDNVEVVSVARVDVCTLANNHVLDYCHPGLVESLDTLAAAGISSTGAGRTREAAWAPASRALPGPGQLRIFGVTTPSSGTPESWAASRHRPGVALLPDLTDATANALLQHINHKRGPGDLTVVSIHWGSNWGYDIPWAQTNFAHRLIDGGVDVIHGHSSHHPRGFELYRDKLILYGCGDFISDYEGIRGYEEFHPELRPLYLLEMDERSGRLTQLRIFVFASRAFRLVHAAAEDVQWLATQLAEESWALSRGLEPFRFDLKHPEAGVAVRPRPRPDVSTRASRNP